MNKVAVGKRGEDIATAYLMRSGMDILERNFRSGKSEIDIIARDNDTIVFAEVKSRSSDEFGTGLCAVTCRKQQMIIKGAESYCAIHDAFDNPTRFDVIEVDLCRGCVTGHIRNAFLSE